MTGAILVPAGLLLCLIQNNVKRLVFLNIYIAMYAADTCKIIVTNDDNDNSGKVFT